MANIESMKIEVRAIEALARDGYSLAATHYVCPDREKFAGVVLFSSATAVPQKFYAPCARFLAKYGYDVYTYDYRGIGASAPKTLRGFAASCETWATEDIAAMIDFVSDCHPDHPLTFFGHSVGGQLLGMADNANRIGRAVFVSSQVGYWKLQGGRQKYIVWVNTHFMLPLISRIFGYFPWSKVASGEDLPKGVALQWAKWCRHKNYLFDDTTLADLGGYAKLKVPLLSYCISDDDWGTYDSVRQLASRYSGTTVEFRDISPSDFGFKNLGHFGFFKRGRDSLWEDALGWIQRPQPNQVL
jgi:predicted alpha/beta hydrolase